MEFLLYLSPAGRDIYNLISQKVQVSENTPICRQYNIYGWYDSRKNNMVVCTDKIKSTSSSLSESIDETIFHESVHIAQDCKSISGYTEKFGISIAQMPLNERRQNDVRSAIAIVGQENYRIEHEAFWMEDKPDKVRYVLQKYCF
jgi:hypothetical protein